MRCYGMAMTVISGFASTIRDLLLPRGCAGCDAPDQVLCPRCRSLFARAYRREFPVGMLGFLYACARYEGPVRHAVLAWKDHGDVECDHVFGAILGDLVVSMLSGRVMTVMTADAVVVVPAPSSLRSMRARQRWHTLALARSVAAVLRTHGVDARMRAILRTRGISHKSVETVTAAQRADRIGGHIEVRCKKPLDGIAVVIVDDIVTTGSTMRQCARVLQAAGAHVVTGFVLAQTPRTDR